MTQTQPPRTRVRARPHTSVDSGSETASMRKRAEHSVTQHKVSAVAHIDPEASPFLMARVTVTDGVTLNMGDFNNFRRDIGLELDVPLGVAEGQDLTEAQAEALDRAMDKCRAWVTEKLSDVVADATLAFEEGN